MAKHTPRLEVFPVTTLGRENAKTFTSTIQHYVRLCSGNGSILMTSEGYSARNNARRAARAVSRIAGGLPILTLDSEGKVIHTVQGPAT